MKVQVNLKSASKGESTSKFDFTVNSEDTVQNVKERIAASQLIAFPEQDLMLDGEVLEDKKMLADCGVKENSSLDFVIQASEASLKRQLTELLQARDLTSDELGLLYCYKHGVSISQALKTLGHPEKFQDFIKQQKEFMVENGRVALIRKDTALKPFSVADEVKRILEESSSGTMDITSLCSKFTQKFNMSIASVVDMRPAEFLAKEKDLFVVTGRGQVCLKSACKGQQGPAEARPRAARRQAEDDRRSSPKVQTPSRAAPANVASAAPVSEDATDCQEYLDLHNKISGRSFNSKIAQILNDVVDVVTEKSFLNISQVVKCGSVGKGTAITGTTDAEVVFFLKGLPQGLHSKWLPAMLKAVAGILTQHLGTGYGVEGICTTADSVHMKVKGLVELDLRFSPCFESYAETIQVLGEQSPDVRKLFATSLAKERADFVAKQPGQVKVTMRLLKWWRDQQQWSSALTQPSDDILELIAVYTALQTKPGDQRVAIANSMSLMARFDELRIVWSNYYGKDDIWSPLLNQRPLLMDPVNPFVNVADPQVFDSRELMSLARATHFFW
jgi:2'-5'-oligoadenylate synthetase